MLIQFFDCVWVIGLLDEAGIVLRGLEDTANDVDPSRQGSLLEQAWLNLRLIQKVENLRNYNHELKLVWSLGLSLLLHNLKHDWQKVVSQIILSGSGAVDGLLGCSCQLLESSQTDELDVLILILHSLLDFIDSVRPLSRQEIMLGNIINYVLN